MEWVRRTSTGVSSVPGNARPWNYRRVKLKSCLRLISKSCQTKLVRRLPSSCRSHFGRRSLQSAKRLPLEVRVDAATPIGCSRTRQRSAARGGGDEAEPVRSIEFDPTAIEDLAWWAEQDRSQAIRIVRLVRHVQRDPFSGIGKPEPLKHELVGCWSRRIDQEHAWFTKPNSLGPPLVRT